MCHTIFRVKGLRSRHYCIQVETKKPQRIIEGMCGIRP